MNHRERVMAILNYEDYDLMPVVHFGLWNETLQKWVDDGHVSEEEASGHTGGNPPPSVMERLGFDFGWPGRGIGGNYGFIPAFEPEVVEELPDGARKVRNADGVIVLQMPGAGSIPAEIDHLLKDRKSWEEHYLPRLQSNEKRIDLQRIEEMKNESSELPLSIFCGSMIGTIRNWVGVEGLSYIYVDDEALLDEIIETHFNLIYRCVEKILATGIRFDMGSYWEDICFKNGPLVIPSVFEEKCGPRYAMLSSLLKEHGTNFSFLDCDGMIDSLIPTWIANGVNIMFPIEVGTWHASIKPWRETYGREMRGVGGMDKKVFAKDYKAVEQEVERLKPLVELGGFIPCPDHRIAPDAKWENIQYYCELMHRTF
ncbi:MAG: hypothetical protein JW808_02375 [Victivallales bacterium]|nr:hypothetical protein [Victivallales bacterium]